MTSPEIQHLFHDSFDDSAEDNSGTPSGCMSTLDAYRRSAQTPTSGYFLKPLRGMGDYFVKPPGYVETTLSNPRGIGDYTPNPGMP